MLRLNSLQRNLAVRVFRSGHGEETTEPLIDGDGNLPTVAFPHLIPFATWYGPDDQ